MRMRMKSLTKKRMRMRRMGMRMRRMRMRRISKETPMRMSWSPMRMLVRKARRKTRLWKKMVSSYHTYDQVSELTVYTVDLTVATSKTLVRLRRDELVRMCEARGIGVDGTKPQLAESLLQWRDRQVSVPSSTATARPPSTARPPRGGRRKSSRNSGSSQKTPVPILLRTHVHVEQPATPPISSPSLPREGVKDGDDGDLELDLAELGLDDREIPPEKLTKLEKIGSGGFKDVYIGRFKNRKVAIAEFRGQLTASKSYLSTM